MKRSFLALTAVALGAAALSSCDNYDSRDDDYADAPPPVEAPVAPSAEDAGEPVVAPDVRDPTPTPAPESLPEDQRTSEQSVRPDSDTLFY